MAITRQQACDLFKYDFKLVDKEGREWTISGIENVVDATIIKLAIGDTSTWINIKQIGEYYHILAHPLDLYNLIVDGFEKQDAEILGWFNDEIIDLDDANNIELDTLPYGSIEYLMSKHFLPHGIEESNVKWITNP